MSAFETEGTAIPEPKSLSSEREYEEVLKEALEKMHRMSRHETDISHVPPHAGPGASASTETEPPPAPSGPASCGDGGGGARHAGERPGFTTPAVSGL